MKLRLWAKNAGVSYKTARRWFRAGLPVEAEQMSTGTIIVRAGRAVTGGAGLYARLVLIRSEKRSRSPAWPACPREAPAPPEGKLAA